MGRLKTDEGKLLQLYIYICCKICCQEYNLIFNLVVWLWRRIQLSSICKALYFYVKKEQEMQFLKASCVCSSFQIQISDKNTRQWQIENNYQSICRATYSEYFTPILQNVSITNGKQQKLKHITKSLWHVQSFYFILKIIVDYSICDNRSSLTRSKAINFN